MESVQQNKTKYCWSLTGKRIYQWVLPLGMTLGQAKSNVVCQSVGPAGECCSVMSKRQQRKAGMVSLNLNSLHGFFELIKQKKKRGENNCETVDLGYILVTTWAVLWLLEMEQVITSWFPFSLQQALKYLKTISLWINLLSFSLTHPTPPHPQNS